MADTPITNNPPNPQVESTASKQVSNVSTAALFQSNPTLGKEYLDYQKQQQAKLEADAIKAYTATEGEPPDSIELSLIRTEAELQAKNDANAKYKDQIIAAGAGTVTQTGTPPPSNPDPAVSATTNPQVPVPPAPAPTAESVVNQSNPAAAQDRYALFVEEQRKLQSSLQEQLARENPTWSPSRVFSTAKLRADTEANAIVDQKLQQQITEASQAPTSVTTDSNPQVPAATPTPPPGPVANTVSATTDPQIPPVQDFGAEPSSVIPPPQDFGTDPQVPIINDFGTEPTFIIPPPQDFGTDPQTPQPSTAVAGPPTPAPKPPSPSPYERFIAQEAAATDAAQAEANKRFQAQIDALNDPQAPQAIPVGNAANLEAVPLDDNATDYGDFIGGNGIEPQPVDYGQELGNGDPGVSNFYGDPLGDKIAELQTEPAAADPVDYGDFIGGNGADPEPVDYGQELGNGNAESAGFADFFSGADTAIADATARALRSAASISPGTDPLAKDSSSGLPASQIKTPSQLAAERQSALVAQAKAQQQVNAQRKQANDGDWRVKIRLAGGADYLYKVKDANGKPAAGILNPLAVTDGVIFPYTPQITTQYAARYSNYELTHSNYKGYFYQGSNVGEININATFTAQDTDEAEYLLAVIQFFRSVTKMFYGQDDASKRGAPPPLVFLQGLGAYQFNLNPCVVANFNYTLPADVDYIRAYSPNYNGTNLLQRRNQQNLPIGYSNSSNSRLSNSGLNKGGINLPPPPPTLGINSPTYVPTKMDVQLVLLPVQTRSQVSQQFSLKQFANGDLVRGGFW